MMHFSVLHLPLHSLHVTRLRLCVHISEPPQSLHRVRILLCMQMLPPLQYLHLDRIRA